MESGVLTLGPAVRIGRWWFRNRSLSPLPWFFLMVVLPPPLHWTTPGILVISAGIFLAESLRIWAVGYAGSATRTRGDGVPRLVHAGPYRWVRNPLYVANIALYTLCCVLFGFSWLALALFIYSCVQYTFIIRFEEDTLIQLFGKPYGDYCAGVTRWGIPAQGAYPSSGHTFNLKQALRSERSTLICIAVMGLIFAIKSTLLK